MGGLPRAGDGLLGAVDGPQLRDHLRDARALPQDTSKRAGDPDAPRALNRRVKDAKSKTAQESFELTNGGVLCFSTRTDSASLGYSFDVIFYDEAQLLPGRRPRR